MKPHVAIVGGGWAGLAAAVRSVQLGLRVSLIEAARHWGGRARRLDVPLPDGTRLPLDNGQHILIGAYRHTLALMQTVGISPTDVLHPMPLDLRFADGSGLAVPRWAQRWPAPLDTLAAVLCARGWEGSARLAFMAHAWRWQRDGFTCSPHLSVAALCHGLPATVMQDLVEPLCVAALNTTAAEASAQVFLTVLRDALWGQGFGPWRASTLLLPRADLGRLLPDAAVDWLHAQGASLRNGTRLRQLVDERTRWRLVTTAGDLEADHVILATGASDAPELLATLPGVAPDWLAQARTLRHEPIATVYLQGELPHGWPGRHPMLALRCRHRAEPAQYVFHRSRLDGTHWPEPLHRRPVLAFVASACRLERAEVEAAVIAQAAHQLELRDAVVLQTVIEKRATFVCAPGLQRPDLAISPRLTAAGDYISGPYPATLEGAVRSGLQAAERAAAQLKAP